MSVQSTVIRILCAEDHALLRGGIVALVDDHAARSVSLGRALNVTQLLCLPAHQGLSVSQLDTGPIRRTTAVYSALFG